jgi:hypothetical protein
LSEGLAFPDLGLMTVYPRKPISKSKYVGENKASWNRTEALSYEGNLGGTTSFLLKIISFKFIILSEMSLILWREKEE